MANEHTLSHEHTGHEHTLSDEHRATARDAGLGSISFISVLAGTVTAFGAFAIVAAIVGASLDGAGVDTEFRTNDWTGSGAVAALASAATLLVAYLFGGYVAGRMARRAALLHGIAVFLLSIIAGAVVGGLVRALGDSQEVEDNLQSIGVPTTTDQIKGVAIAGALASLAAILIGALLGAKLGERWHSKLARRADDPSYGPEAEDRARAEREEADRRDRIEREEAGRRDTVDRTDRPVDVDRTADERAEAGGAVRGGPADYDQGVRGDTRDRNDGPGDLRGDTGDRSEPAYSDQGVRSDAGDRDAERGGLRGGSADPDEVRYTAAEWRRMEGGQPGSPTDRTDR